MDPSCQQQRLTIMPTGQKIILYLLIKKWIMDVVTISEDVFGFGLCS
jgi:hypothetical protein